MPHQRLFFSLLLLVMVVIFFECGRVILFCTKPGPVRQSEYRETSQPRQASECGETREALRETPTNGSLPPPGRTFEITSNDRPPAYFQVRYLLEPDLDLVVNRTLVVYVHSAPSHAYLRDLIRSTWGNTTAYRHRYPDFTFSVVFVLGCMVDGDQVSYRRALVQLESEHYRDLLVGDFLDTYDNLTYKGLVAMEWVRQRVSGVAHVLKTDDDVVVNLVGWLRVWEAMAERNRTDYIVGLVWDTPRVRRQIPGALTLEEYPAEHFPSFCSGSGYLLPAPTVDKLLTGVPHVPVIRKDDPYFTGLLALYVRTALYRVPYEYYKVLDAPYCDINRVHFSGLLLIHDLHPSRWSDLLGKLLDEEQKNDFEVDVQLVPFDQRTV